MGEEKWECAQGNPSQEIKLVVKNWPGLLYKSRLSSTADCLCLPTTGEFCVERPRLLPEWCVQYTPPLKEPCLGNTWLLTQRTGRGRWQDPQQPTREKKDSHDIRSKDFLSSAFGFTWQVKRSSLAGCLLDWTWQNRGVKCNIDCHPPLAQPHGPGGWVHHTFDKV